MLSLFKKLFNRTATLKQKKTYLRVTFENPKTNQLGYLHFRLNDHPFVEKWYKNINKNLQRPILDSGVFYGNCVNDKESVLAVMLESVAIVNEFAPDASYRIEMKPHMDVDMKFLAALHKEFERLSVDLTVYADQRRKVSDALINLNASIHQMEAFAREDLPEEPPPHFSFDVNFIGAPILPLESKDYDYFTLNRRYGELYLNYNTVGVPVYYAYVQREEEPPVPQSTYKADFTVSFNPELEFKDWDGLGDWIDKKYGMNIQDKKLALGYISLGQCVEVGVQSPKEIANFVKNHRKIVNVDFVNAF